MGTGGALFRNLYRDFLLKSYEVTSQIELMDASNAFHRIAALWTRVADHFYDAGKSEDVEHINHASDLLVDISAKEKDVMVDLLSAADR